MAQLEGLEVEKGMDHKVLMNKVEDPLTIGRYKFVYYDKPAFISVGNGFLGLSRPYCEKTRLKEGDTVSILVDKERRAILLEKDDLNGLSIKVTNKNATGKYKYSSWYINVTLNKVLPIGRYYLEEKSGVCVFG